MTGGLAEELVVSSGAGLERYEIPAWRDQFGVVAGITSAASDFRLAGTPPRGEARSSWDQFRTMFSGSFPAVVVGYQSHGTAVVVHRDPGSNWQAWQDVDGHVTEAPGILLAATVADCIPIYLTDPERRAVGLLHAGWRGLAGGIVEQGVAAMLSVTGSSTADIVSHCGIGICGDCYEVGPEVVERVLSRPAEGPQPLDLRAAIAERMTRLGVGLTTLSPWCSAHHAPRFHSHRGSKGSTGRMLAYIGVPLA